MSSVSMMLLFFSAIFSAKLKDKGKLSFGNWHINLSQTKGAEMYAPNVTFKKDGIDTYRFKVFSWIQVPTQIAFLPLFVFLCAIATEPVYMQNRPKQDFTRPLVNVLVPTYNHGRFIDACLQGIADQVCSFDVEIILCDDASSDNTVALVQAFAEKHGIRLNPTFRTTNVGMNQNVLEGFSRCTAPYIAICEGDDHWTDSEKLQRQIDFLEKNPNYSICFHPVKIICGKDEVLSNLDTPETTTTAELCKKNFIHTASAVLRNYKLEFPDWMYKTAAPDYGIFMYTAQHGPVKMLDATMAIYRKHPGGIWSNLGDYEMREKIVSYLLLMRGQFDADINAAMTKRLEIVLESLINAYGNKPELLDKWKQYVQMMKGLRPDFEPTEKSAQDNRASFFTRKLNTIQNRLRRLRS